MLKFLRFNIPTDQINFEEESQNRDENEKKAQKKKPNPEKGGEEGGESGENISVSRYKLLFYFLNDLLLELCFRALRKRNHQCQMPAWLPPVQTSVRRMVPATILPIRASVNPEPFLSEFYHLSIKMVIFSKSLCC